MINLILKDDRFAEIVALAALREMSKTKANFIWDKRRVAGRWEPYFRKKTRAFEEKFKKSISASFAKQKREVLSNIKKHPTIPKKSLAKKSFDFSGWMFDIEEWQAALEEMGGEFIKMMYDEIGAEIFESLSMLAGEGLELAWNVESAEALAFIEDYAFSFAEEISASVAADLEAALAEGIEAGLDIDGIASMIENIYDGWEGWRSELIARTETIRASNAGAEEAYKQSGVVEGKEWLVTEDDRTCEECMEMSEEYRSLGENFAEGDDPEDPYNDTPYPPLHPNCRCTIVPVLKEEYQAVAEGENEEMGLSRIMIVGKGGPGSGRHPERGSKITDRDMASSFSTMGLIRVDASFHDFKKSEEKEKAFDAIKSSYKGMQKDFPILKEVPGLRFLEVYGGMSISSNDRLKMGALGTYSDLLETVSIAKGEGWGKSSNPRESNNSRDAFRHEMAHHLDRILVSAKFQGVSLSSDAENALRGLRTDFRAAYKNLAPKDIVKGITKYASTNRDECFAESFMIYTHPNYGEKGIARLPKAIEKAFTTHLPRAGKKFGIGSILKVKKVTGVKD